MALIEVTSDLILAKASGLFFVLILLGQSTTLGKTGHPLLCKLSSLGFSELPLRCPLFLFLFLPSWQPLPQMAIWGMFYRHLLNQPLPRQWFSEYVFVIYKPLAWPMVWLCFLFPNHRGSRDPILCSPTILQPHCPPAIPQALQGLSNCCAFSLECSFHNPHAAANSLLGSQPNVSLSRNL